MTAMFTALAIVSVAQAGKWDDRETDVRVTKLIASPPRAIHEALDELAEWKARWPDDCATDFTVGPAQTGSVRYTFGPLRRKLDMKVIRNEAGHVFEIEHPGKRGWFTQVTYREVDAGTEVALLTPLEAPPWPFKPVFFNKIRPAMEDCYARWLDGVATDVAERG